MILLFALCGLVSLGQAQVPYLVKDVHQSATFNTGPQRLTDVNGTLFFSGSDQLYTNILWKSDGTEAGTVVVKNQQLGGSNGDGNLRNINGTLFFTAFDSVYVNQELWKSDGTTSGTVRVADIYPGPESSIGYEVDIVAFNGNAYFTANNGTNGFELWRSNGTAAGTVLLKDINPGIGDAYPNHLIVMNGKLYFFADNGTSGTELWKTDGTSAGTVMVKDIIPGANGVTLQPAFANVNGTLFFCVYKGIYMNELWKSDGTDAGTVRVNHSGGIYAFATPITEMVSFNNTLYFTTGGIIDLWKSDGTDAGTVQLTFLYAGSGFAGSGNLINATNALLFTASEFNYGSELWRSNGTLNNTVLVKDIRVGKPSSSPGGYLHVNGTTYFSAQDGANGTEVWKTDGTLAGTAQLMDINPGAGFATPTGFKLSNNRVFFVANDGVHENELWALDLMTSNEHVSTPDGMTIGLFPNPVSTMLTILSSDKMGEAEYVIRDLSGRLLINGVLKGETTLVNVSELVSGQYVLCVGGLLPRAFQVVRP